MTAHQRCCSMLSPPPFRMFASVGRLATPQMDKFASRTQTASLICLPAAKASSLKPVWLK